MDSLARVLHEYDPRAMGLGGMANPVVTSVALDARHGELVIGRNETDAQLQQRTARRVAAVRDVLRSRRSAAEVARELAPTSGLPNFGDGLSPERRIRRDLRKLRRTYSGADDERSWRSGRTLRKDLRSVFGGEHSPRIRDVTQGRTAEGTVHAESAVIAAGVPGPVGTSKLSCDVCFEYGRRMRREGDLRGTHGLSFPGTLAPDQRRSVRGSGGHANQYPSDSESESEADR